MNTKSERRTGEFRVLRKPIYKTKRAGPYYVEEVDYYQDTFQEKWEILDEETGRNEWRDVPIVYVDVDRKKPTAEAQ